MIKNFAERLSKFPRLMVRVLQEFKFIVFLSKIDRRTWKHHDAILDWGYRQTDSAATVSDDIVTCGSELRTKLLCSFKDKYRAMHEFRIMIHVPPKAVSPGGFSLFSNLADSLEYIGIPVKKLFWEDNFSDALDSFSPTHFLSSDHSQYLSKIDWDKVAEYKRAKFFSVGLTASVDDQGSITLLDRLQWGKKHGIDFYYGFRAEEYFKTREGYSLYREFGYEIVSIEFGANPLIYYPVSVPAKDLNFIFLASSNIDKHKQYFEWLPQIVFKDPGFIDGPGWYRVKRYAPREIHRFLYARAKVGLNLHIDDSLNWASELNERTYILAACGIPQLIDNPKLLFGRFSRGAVFSASTPAEYSQLYKHILTDTADANNRALTALKEVYAKHTTLHRAEDLICKLRAIRKI